MSTRAARIAGVVIIGAAGVIGMTAAAVALQGPDRPKLRHRPPLRVEVVPPERLYRQCSDTPYVEHRASGDTVVPRSRCWWAVR